MDRTWVPSVLGYLPRNILYVDSVNGSTSNNGLLRSSAKATIAQALTLVADGMGDCIVVLPGHTETLATTTAGVSITGSHDGVSILGCGNARNRPTLTCGAADVTGVLVSGANVRLHNLRIVGSTSQTGAAVGCLSITGADAKVTNCVFEHGGAGPLQAVYLSLSHRAVFENCEWLGTGAGPDMGIKVSNSGATNLRIRDCVFDYGVVNVDSAAIGCIAGSGIPNSIIENCVILGANSSAIRILGSGAATVADGIIKNCYAVSSTGITAAAAMPWDLGSLALSNCFWTDAVAASTAWMGVAIPPVAGTAGCKAFFPSSVPT